MPRELWAKVAVEVIRDPKLLARAPWERWLWVCLICTAKELAEQDGVLRGFDARSLASVFDLRVPPAKVRAALDAFEKAGMVRLHQDGSIELVHFVRRQAASKDTPEAARDRQQTRRDRKKAARDAERVTGNVTGDPTRDAPVMRHAEEEEEEDPDRKKEENTVPGIRPNGGQQRPPESWDPRLLAAVRTALGKTDLDHDWQQFVGGSLRYPNAQREPAVREFLDRGCAEDGKGVSYLLAMIRDGAGQRRERKGEVPAAARTGPVVPDRQRTAAALAALDVPQPTAEELAHAKALVDELRLGVRVRARP